MSEVGPSIAFGEPLGQLEPGRPEPGRPEPPRAGGHEPGALPIRLSVARGGLGIELTRSLSLGALVIETLELGLLGLKFPVDLSKGVKQFRNRRALLEKVAVRVSFDGLAEALRSGASELFGEAILGVRITSVGEETGTGRDVGMAVVVYSETKVLAFDVVLVSAAAALFAVDRARGIGLSAPALEFALKFVDLMPKAWGTSGFVVPSGENEPFRTGRLFQVRDFVPTLLLHSLPAMGFRLPVSGGEVLTACAVEQGKLLLTFERGGEPLSLGRRGVRLSGVGRLLSHADGLLAAGDRTGARAGYLAALEEAPRQAEALLGLAAIDGVAQGRAEVAGSFLEELTVPEAELRAAEVALLSAEILLATGRTPLALERLLDAARREGESVVSAMIYGRLGALSEGKTKGEFLDLAVRAAPTLPSARRARFLASAERGDLPLASIDAEHLAATGTSATFELLVFVGSTLARSGYHREAVKWLSRALQTAPDAPFVKLLLGRTLVECHERLRGLSLLLSALEGIERPEREPFFAVEEEELASTRLLVAELLVSELSDASQAIGQARKVETRSRVGPAARALEGRLSVLLGDTESRLRAHGRLLDALELGWVSVPSALVPLREVAEQEASLKNPELALRVCRLTEERFGTLPLNAEERIVFDAIVSLGAGLREA